MSNLQIPESYQTGNEVEGDCEVPAGENAGPKNRPDAETEKLSIDDDGADASGLPEKPLIHAGKAQAGQEHAEAYSHQSQVDVEITENRQNRAPETGADGAPHPLGGLQTEVRFIGPVNSGNPVIKIAQMRFAVIIISQSGNGFKDGQIKSGFLVGIFSGTAGPKESLVHSVDLGYFVLSEEFPGLGKFRPGIKFITEQRDKTDGDVKRQKNRNQSD